MFTPQMEDEILLSVLLKEQVAKLSLKRKAIIGLLTTGYTQADAAIILGISRTSIGDMYRKTVQYLRTKLTSSEED